MVFFLKFKKVLVLLMLIQVFLEANSRAGEHNEPDEESCCSGALRKLSSVFTCFFGGYIENSAQYHYRGIAGYAEGNEIEELVSTESTEIHPIDMLPSEILYQVAVFLSPPDIINLIKSSKKFSCLRDNKFWVYYNKEYSYSSWSRELPAIRVTFSYHWFKNGKVREAGVMGFPRANEFIRQQEKLKRENSRPYKTSGYVRYNFYDDAPMRRNPFYRRYW